MDEYEETRTDPTKKDTDGDGLNDNVETNTGEWVSINSTGTDPLNSDSDNDTLADGVENPDLPYNEDDPEDQPGTERLPNFGSPLGCLGIPLDIYMLSLIHI